jgi:hypothetical protein
MEMPSVDLRLGRCLMLALLLAPVVVRPKGLEFEENEWTSGEAKRESGLYDNLADKNTKKRATTSKPATVGSINDPTIDRSLRLLDDDATDPSATGAPVAEGSTSGGNSLWMWGILGSLCMAGVGLACFSYYWSHMRRVPSW